MTGFTRRTMVGGLALAGLAGCTGLRNGGGGNGGAVFEDVRVGGTSLVVSLAGSAEVDSLTIVSPDGSEFASRSVGAGVSKVSVKLGVQYTPGEHSVVAAREGETVGETTIAIRPDVEIVEVGVGANHLEKMPENLNYREEQCLIKIENQGNGPELLKKLLVLGKVPNPTTELRNQEDATGIYDTGDGYGQMKRPVVPGGTTKSFFSTTKPFLVTGDGIECKSNQQDGECQVEIPAEISSDTLSQDYLVRYSGAERRDGCTGNFVRRMD